jgi:hypothetical protein
MLLLSKERCLALRLRFTPPIGCIFVCWLKPSEMSTDDGSRDVSLIVRSVAGKALSENHCISDTVKNNSLKGTHPFPARLSSHGVKREKALMW